VDDVNTWHDHDEESMCISILQNKLRLSKLNTFYLSGRSFFFLPCLRTIAKLIESCIYFGTKLYGRPAFHHFLQICAMPALAH
jgi:hypothetical protein